MRLPPSGRFGYRRHVFPRDTAEVLKKQSDVREEITTNTNIGETYVIGNKNIAKVRGQA